MVSLSVYAMVPKLTLNLQLESERRISMVAMLLCMSALLSKVGKVDNLFRLENLLTPSRLRASMSS
jgi:hypothetical protein